jgi:glyoxylase-like metal-dependent hydrolase (beta-lactamase superfamily II)
MDEFNGILRVPILFVNAYIVESGGGWTLVDTGLRGAGAALIRRAAEARFGPGTRPQSIVLTHGHFDHAGSAHTLAHEWQVPVYAHTHELPYLTGRSDYPPQDPTVGGALANLSRLFPTSGIDLGTHVHPVSEDTDVPGMPGWRAIHTPGHTPGHMSLFRASDRVLLAGDALATMDQDSTIELLRQTRQLRWPPAALTVDWDAAQRSIEHLAEVRPFVIAAGHGLPVGGGAEVADALEMFALNFERPSHGRYVEQPVRADEGGIRSVPPPVADPVGRALRVAGLAAAAATVTLAVRRTRPAA